MPTLQSHTASAATRGRLFILGAGIGGRMDSARADVRVLLADQGNLTGIAYVESRRRAAPCPETRTRTRVFRCRP